MKVLLTGAVGRLGRNTWRALLDSGHEVRATDCRHRRDMPGELAMANLIDELACYRLIEGCDAIIHLGNIPYMDRGQSPQAIYRTNTAININVFQAAFDLGVNNLAFASTVQVIAGVRGQAASDRPSHLPYLPGDGDLPALPGNTYALSKQASEDMLRHYALLNEAGCYVACRFPWLPDADDVVKFAGYNRSEAGKQRYWKRAQGEAQAFLAIEDAAALLCRIVENPKTGYRQYFPAVDRMQPGHSVEEVIDALYAHVPLRKPIEQLTSLVDITALADDFGWEPTHSRDAVRRAEQQQDEAAPG